jgi:hypothetical protein
VHPVEAKRLALPPRSATATDVLQLGGGSGVLSAERVVIDCARSVFLDQRGLLGFRRGRRVITGEPLVRVFDRAALPAGGKSALRDGTERQNSEDSFHLNSFRQSNTKYHLEA